MNAQSFGSNDQEESQQEMDQSDVGMIIGEELLPRDELLRSDELFGARLSNRDSRHSTIQITDSSGSDSDSDISESEQRDVVTNRSPTFTNR